MSIETQTAESDAQAVLNHLLYKQPLDPETYKRIHDRAAKITEKLCDQYGTLDIAVDLIRETREE
ncbi:MAG TPA: hypothetical protein VGN42_09520 [Pirellulales bacterium]|jgi:hypothetical protein|nr:hypothetical protein [Pirellulales bacterium]